MGRKAERLFMWSAVQVGAAVLSTIAQWWTWALVGFDEKIGLAWGWTSATVFLLGVAGALASYEESDQDAD